MQIYTLKDLAEHRYQRWLMTGDIELPPGSIKWIRDSLGEPELAEQIDKVLSADIKPSEKCYRFLKLTGIIERERLTQLLRKQTMDEIEKDGAERLLAVDEQWQAKIVGQRQRIFNKPDDRAYSFIVFAVIACFVGAVIGTIAASFSFIQASGPVRGLVEIVEAIVSGAPESGSADIGWRVGLIIGAIAAYGYRRIRTSTLTGHFINFAREGIETQKRGIEESIRDRKTNIDADIIQLITKYSIPLSESADNRQSNNVSTSETTFAGQTSQNYRYAGLVAIAGMLLVFTPSFIMSIGGKNITNTTTNEREDLNTLAEASKAPTVVRDTFPFEGGLLGKWTAKEELIAYQSEGDTSRIAYTIMPNEDITAITSNVHVDHIGIAKVNEDVHPDIGNGSPNTDFFSRRGLKRGDIIGVICYAGEGYCYIWVKGKMACISMFWLEPDSKINKGSWIKKYDDAPSLWVKVNNHKGDVGWLRLARSDYAKISGMDRFE